MLALGSHGELCWDPRLCQLPARALGAQPTNLFLAGDCHFVSATFRLFKVLGSSRAGPGQVIYNGGIVGHERELVFDANFTFKVRGGTPQDAKQSWSVGMGMGQS